MNPNPAPSGLPPATRNSVPSSADTLRMVLPNGITVLARPNFNSPSVTVSGYLQVGALFDDDKKLGISDFTSLSLMRGTAKHNFQQLYESLESTGASFGYSGGTHTTGFGGKALAEDLDLLLEMLSETLHQPSFPPEQVERLRVQILTHLAIQAQDTGDMASLAFDEMLYPDHPYSRPEDGTPDTVRAIQRDDLIEFHRKYYGPRNMVIAIVGAVEPERAAEMVTSYLGDWKNPEQPDPPELPPAPPPQAILRRKVDLAGKSQADIVLGTVGPKRSDPDFLSAALGNNILGQFGMYGRIGGVVREQHGLAYHAYSSLSGGIGPGPWYVSAGTNPADVEKTIGLIRVEMRRFVNEPVSPEELDDSQANFIGRLPLSLESNGGVAASLVNLERYQLDRDYYLYYPDRVREVTPAKVLETARRFLDHDRLVIAIAGPPETGRKQRKTRIKRQAA